MDQSQLNWLTNFIWNIADDAQLFKPFQDNESVRHWLTDTIFGLTYEE
jgi:hypothetical protein